MKTLESERATGNIRLLADPAGGSVRPADVNQFLLSLGASKLEASLVVLSLPELEQRIAKRSVQPPSLTHNCWL